MLIDKGDEIMIEMNVMTKSKVSELIQNTVFNDGLTYMDAIIHICEKNNIEIEDIKKFISPIIKEKVEAEAMNLNYLPKQNELNF